MTKLSEISEPTMQLRWQRIATPIWAAPGAQSGWKYKNTLQQLWRVTGPDGQRQEWRNIEIHEVYND